MDPSRNTTSKQSTVNSTTTSINAPEAGDKTPVTGKDQQGRKIRQEHGKNNIPSSTGVRQPTSDLSKQAFDSVTEVKPQTNWLIRWFSGFLSDSKDEAAKNTVSSNPKTHPENRSPQKAGVASTGWFDSLPAWLTGKKVEQAKSSGAVIPPAERNETFQPSLFTKAINFVTSAVRMVNAATRGVIGEVSDDALSYFTGKSFAGHTRQFLANKGTRFPTINEKEFQAMLGNIARLLASNPNVIDSEFQHIEIPNIEIDQGMATPLRVKGLKLRARLVPYPKDCPLIQRQTFQRAIEIEGLECKVDLPRPDQAPSALDVSLPKGVLSVGSSITASTGITDIGRLLVSGSNESLPFDHTAIQLKGDTLRVGFRKINSASPFDITAPPSLTAPGVLGFNNGVCELRDLCISTPASIFRPAPDQTTIVQCSGFKLDNEVSRDLLVNLRSIDASSLDQQLSGPLKVDIGLDISKVKHFPGMSLVPRFLLNAQIDCQIDTQLRKGELDFKQLKAGIQFTPSKNNWWSSKIANWLNDIMSSDQTTLIAGSDGTPNVRFYLPSPFKKIFGKIPFIGRFIPSELPIPIDIPLPVRGLSPSSDNPGKWVAVDWVSDVLETLKMDWFQLSGKAQLVQQNHEQLCIAAASGDFSASKTLTTIASELDASGHSGQALRIWQAIPSAHFAPLIRENTRLSSNVISNMAHRMVEVDPAKAIALYGLTLKDTPIGKLPENYNFEAVMSAARKLDLSKPNEMAAAFDVYEFLSMAQPQSTAFATLRQHFRTGLYPSRRMSGLVTKMIHLPPYLGNPSLQATLLEELEELKPSLGDTIKEALISLPTHQLSRHNGISAAETAAHFEPLMLKYHLEVQAARMYQNINNPDKAREILEQCIQQGGEGAASALEERITSEAYHGSYGLPRYISGYQFLMSMNGQLSRELQQTREHMLKVLWRESRDQAIQWPGLRPDKAELPSVAQCRDAESKLFAISEQDADNPGKLLEILTDIHKDIIKAENLTPNPEQTFPQLIQLKQLVNNLMVDTAIQMEALEYMKSEQLI